MSIRNNRDSVNVVITADEMFIDAAWNHFNTLAEARTYIAEGKLVIKPGVKYGYLVMQQTLWDVTPGAPECIELRQEKT